MKAAVIDRYGPPNVLEVRDVPTPKPRADQVLIEVHAASVNPIDWKIRNGSLKLIFGARFPKILGFDVSGRVASVGSAVKRFKRGDPVYARSDAKTGQTYAEFVAVGEKTVARRPERMNDEEAAAVPLAALTALQGMRDDGKLRSGERILIIGASGGVGSYAVQIAKAIGAEVTAVCSTPNIGLVKALGADTVVDYKKQAVMESERPYDVVFDAVAAHNFSEAGKILKRRGVYLSTLPSPRLIASMLWTKLIPGQRAVFVRVRPEGRDLETLAGWIDAGKIKSVLDSTFPLDAIRKAHHRSESGHARGKIVVRVKA